MSSPPSLLTLPFREAVWTLAWPTIVLGLLRSGYFLANSFWVGMMGKEALAAIGGAAFASWIVFALTEIGATGLYSQVAQATGAGDRERARRALGHGLVLATLLGVLLSGLVYATRGLYFELLGVEGGPVRELGMAYLGASAIGTLPVTLLTTLTAVFRAIGNTRTPMWIYGTTLAFNAAIDPLFIYGALGWPGLGIVGPALASALAYALAAGWSFWTLWRRGYAPRLERLEWGWLGRLALIGLPIAASGTGFSLVYVLLGREINRFGPAALAAVGLGHRIESLGFLACVGFQVAATTLVGQWIGAGSPEKALEAARAVQRQMLRLMLPVSIVVTVLAPLFILPFSDDPEVVRHGGWYLRLNGAVMMLMGLEVLYEGAFSGVGRTLPALLIAFPLTVARIPLGHLLAVSLGLGATGIWLAIALSTSVKGLLMRAWFRRSIHQVAARTGPAEPGEGPTRLEHPANPQA